MKKVRWIPSINAFAIQLFSNCSIHIANMFKQFYILPEYCSSNFYDNLLFSIFLYAFLWPQVLEPSVYA